MIPRIRPNRNGVGSIISPSLESIYGKDSNLSRVGAHKFSPCGIA